MEEISKESVTPLKVLDLGATLVGILTGEESSVIIDTGMTTSQAKKIEKALTKPLRAAVLTHMHADHTGGADYFASKGAHIYMPLKELSFAYAPELNADLLYGGRTASLYQKPFLKSESVKALPVTEEELVIDDIRLTPIETNGHSVGHTSYLAGSALFLGDALISPQVTAKHGILYSYCPEKSLKSLDSLKEIAFESAVISHKEELTRPCALEYAEAQKAHILGVFKDIKEILTERRSAKSVTEKLFLKRDIAVTPEAWLLAVSTIKGYLASLERSGEITATFEEAERDILFQLPVGKAGTYNFR